MLLRLADWLVYECAGLSPESHDAAALHFFLYDTAKIFLLLAAMIFVIGLLRSYLPEDKLKGWMRSGGIWGNAFAAAFGALTPFCSCSSIPIFIGFLKAGAPLGATFSFLITSPIINEYLAVLMAAEFGLPITVVYIASGLLIGTLAGYLLGKMNLESLLESDMAETLSKDPSAITPTAASRIRYAWSETCEVIRQVWIWILVGVAAGALIHNYVPRETIHGMIASTGPFSVPLATGLGAPLYGSCAAIVPIAVVLFEKGIPLGTALAFMMAMAALSLPEAIMLRRAMHLKLIALFFAITTVAIIITGYLINALAPLLSH